jgi:protein-S-isoprenylcysteine O-methyltransferase Ste14
VVAEAEKDAAAVRIIPPLVPLVAILAGVALGRLWPIPAGAAFAGPAHRWIGGLIVAGAVAFAAWAVVVMRRTGQSPNPTESTPEIIAHGPYVFSRNPMYLSMILLCLGFAVLLGNAWILLLTPVCGWVLYRLAILPEEAYLERKFGESFRSYRQRVRRWI